MPDALRGMGAGGCAGDKGGGDSSRRSRGWGPGSRSPHDYTWSEEAPRIGSQVCTGEPDAQKPRPQGRWGPVSSKWLQHLKACVASPLVERSSSNVGSGRAQEITVTLSRADLTTQRSKEGSPAQNPLATRIYLSRKWVC